VQHTHFRRTPLTRSRRAAPRLLGRSQRGVFGIMAAFMLVLIIAGAMLALDSGRLMVERRAVQRAADMAALSASRFIGCGATPADAQAAAKAVAQNMGIDPSTITVTYGSLAAGSDKSMTFTADRNVETADALQVSLSKTVRTSLLDAGLGSTKVAATATAKGNLPVSSFTLNSVYGVNQSMADATSGLFGAILGTSNLNLSPADLEALGKQTLTLNDMMKAAGTTDLATLLETRYTLGSMLNIVAAANPNIAGNTAFSKIRTAAQARSNITLKLSQVLSVYMPASAGVKEAHLNMLDLIITGVQVGGFNGGGIFNYGIPGGIFTFNVQMLNAPKLALGAPNRGLNGWCTTSQSSQVSIRVGIDLSWLLGLADMVLRVDTSSVQAQMTELQVSPGQINAVVNSQSSAVTVVLTNNKDVNNPLFPDTFGPAKVLGGFVGIKLYQQALAGAPINKTLTFSSRNDLPTAVKLGAGSLGQSITGLLGNKSNFEVSILWNLFKLRADFLDDLVSFIMAPLGALIDGTLATFGIQTGSVYLQVRSIDQMQPVLVR